jgi:hypothetical protein
MLARVPHLVTFEQVADAAEGTKSRRKKTSS